jgi:hypothetical protein
VANKHLERRGRDLKVDRGGADDNGVGVNGKAPSSQVLDPD